MSAPQGMRKPSWDVPLLAAVLCLTALGLIMVFSASGIVAEKTMGSKYVLFQKQLFFVGLGLMAMMAAMRIPVTFFQRHVYWWVFVALVLLILTLASPLGVRIGGARRWLHLGPLSFQPLEMAKIALVLYLGYFFSRKQEKVKTFSVGFLPPLLMTALFCLLLMLQPDFGGSVFLAAILFLLCFVGGTRLIFLGASVLLAVVGGILLVIHSPYRLKRAFAFLDPFQDAQNTGYQLVQSFYGLGSGGWWGVGLGAGRQKLFFLPEAHNDFILAVMGEELGFVGLSLVFALVAVILWRVFAITLRQRDLERRILALGMGSIILLGALLNSAVVLGLLPPKGVPMPFVSYGGSHILGGFFCVGMLLNLSREGAP
ncbi:MAG: putative lipid II flippase FtsW [Desulfomicrobiaceae bacterium]|nr:putative lipid II flippase FtsW [Desulfomicrobiaceae bacterium]